MKDPFPKACTRFIASFKLGKFDVNALLMQIKTKTNGYREKEGDRDFTQVSVITTSNIQLS